MTNETETNNDEIENLDEVKEAVVELQSSLLVAWDNFEEILNELKEPPLLQSLNSVLGNFSSSHFTLLKNNIASNSMQFGREIHAFRQVTESILAIFDSSEFSAAQWGVTFASIENKSEFPAAIMDCFNLKYCPENGFSICGIKPIFEDEDLTVHAWGAAHSLVEIGLLAPIYLANLPTPAKKYFHSFDNDSEEGTNAK
jgi:hypothetical protein